MAKITYSKLGLKTNTDIASFEENGQKVEVKQYLSLDEKLAMATKIINASYTESKFYNVGMIEMNLALEIIFNYTNVTFTDKQKENPQKLYDTLVSSGFYDDVLHCIPQKEYQWISNTVYHTISKIYEYQNSVYGVLDTINTDYDNLNLDASKIQQKLADGENVEFLKDVLTKLG